MFKSNNTPHTHTVAHEPGTHKGGKCAVTALGQCYCLFLGCFWQCSDKHRQKSLLRFFFLFKFVHTIFVNWSGIAPQFVVTAVTSDPGQSGLNTWIFPTVLEAGSARYLQIHCLVTACLLVASIWLLVVYAHSQRKAGQLLTSFCANQMYEGLTLRT